MVSPRIRGFAKQYIRTKILQKEKQMTVHETNEEYPSTGDRPGTHVHASGDVKLRTADAPGVNMVEPGVIAITWATIRELYERGLARRAKGASS